MSDKKVPVFVGESVYRIEIGRAEIEELTDGTLLVNISIDNPDWGDWSIHGFNPMRLRGIIPPEFKKPLVGPTSHNYDATMAQIPDKMAKDFEDWKAGS